MNQTNDGKQDRFEFIKQSHQSFRCKIRSVWWYHSLVNWGM